MVDEHFRKLRDEMDALSGASLRREMDELTGAATRQEMDDLTGASLRRQADELSGASARREMDELTGAATRQEMDDLTGAAVRTEMGEVASVIARRELDRILDKSRILLYRRIVEEQPALRVALLEDDFYERFATSIESIRELDAVTGLSQEADKFLRHMLFANVITCLETYLGDALISTIKSSRNFMRSFVESYRDFGERKILLKDLFSEYDGIDRAVIQVLANLIYHDLARVKGIYKGAIGVSFPEEMEHLYRAVLVRHDVVHRNGKDKDGILHSISSANIDELIVQVCRFVDNINRQIVYMREGRAVKD